MKKKFLLAPVALLCIVLCAFIFAACNKNNDVSDVDEGNTDITDTVEEKGTQGLDYKLSSDGTYYIVAGIGTAADTDIVVPEMHAGKPVKDIGSSAFAYCKKIKNITIPDSVTSIEFGAFIGCKGLTQIKIPNSVVYIGNAAFYSCTGLTDLTIGNGVTVIGLNAFKYCTSLSSINVYPLNKTFRSLGNCLIETENKILRLGCKNSVIPTDGSVTSIGEEAFNGCSNLKSITIPGSVWRISPNAFSGCSKLSDVTFEEGVVSIEKDAFYVCENLTSIAIPDSVTHIGDNAFRYCYRLTEVYNKSSLAVTAGNEDNGCVGFYAKNVYTPTEGTSKITADSNGFIIYDGNTLVNYVGTEKEIVIPDCITCINSYALYNRMDLTSVTIPDGVTRIGEEAFYGCIGLTSITIPENVKSIEKFAFNWCCRLVEVCNKSSLNIGIQSEVNGDVGYYAKNIYTPTTGTSKLAVDENGFVIYDGDTLIDYAGTATEITIPDCIRVINAGALYKRDKLTSVKIPDSVTYIADFAFEGCINLTNVTIGNGVTSIGESAFGGCTDLTDIRLPDSVTNIEKCAFLGCTDLTDINIPDSVTNIGVNAFYSTAWYNNQPDGLIYVGKIVYGYKGIMSPKTVIEIKEGTLKIASETFRDCVGLTSVTIPDSLISIGSYAFGNCTGLVSVIIPGSVMNIGYKAFENCTGLTSLKIDNGVTSIGSSAFYNCTALASITIPDSLISIGSSAFYNTAWYDNQPDGLVYAGEVVYKYKGKIPANTTVEIKEGTLGIADSAFLTCVDLTSISIPDSMINIGYWAFENCTGLTAVYINDLAKWCESYFVSNPLAYANNLYVKGELVTELVIPDGVEKIARQAFGGCTGFTSITIPDSVKDIEYRAFENCTGLTSITFNGTKAQWNAIYKSPVWNLNTGNYIIHCTDGDIAKS